MIRNCDFIEISDGHTYHANDMVKADTMGCAGCHKCCTGMGTSIVLDPFDVWRMRQFSDDVSMTFEGLLQTGKIELNMVDGLILPNLRMNEKDSCSFLDENGRCTVHSVRPGICRLFPLGRVYEDGGFSYFLQKNECIKENRTKIKVRKWIDTTNLAKNEEYILAWHTFIRFVGDEMIKLRDKGTGEVMNEVAMYVLNTFYVKMQETLVDALAENKTDEVSVYDMMIAMINQATENIKRLIG